MLRSATQPNRNKFLTLKNAVAFLPLVMIPFGLLARQALADGRFYVSDAVFATITLVYIATSIIWFWYITKMGRSKAVEIVYMTLFHILALLFVLFVSGYMSAFLATWIVLMISTNILFGLRGFAASLIGLFIAGALSIMIHPEISRSEQLEIYQTILVISAIGFVIMRIRATADKERAALKTRKKELYQREQLLALVNSMGDAVVATDDSGIIKVYNSTLLSLLDTNTSLEGKSIDTILKLTDRTNQRVNILQEAYARRTVFSRNDVSHKFASGEKMRLYINIAPIHPNYQSHTKNGFIIILRDITKEKTLEEERDEFISVVSHELRTPVAIAEGGLSNIVLLQERGAALAVIKSAAKSAHDQVMYLSKLVNDLSALSRAERGLGAETSMINLTELLHDIYTNYLPQAQAKNLNLDLDIHTSHLPKLISSQLYIEEIIQNLVTNAIKYTQKGSITIKARLHKNGIQIHIIDTGIGISKADQKHMFEKFYRSEDYRTRESSGTGLGLYVCKKLAEKIGLKLDFDSRLNHGSTFILTIPPKHFASSEAAEPKASEAQKQGSTHFGLST